jgi:hypothetical protein
MERELWPVIYRELRAVAREVEQKYVHHHPWRVAAVLLWAAVHDRPVSWACDRGNWSTTRLRPAEIPSAATVSRRARRSGFGVFLALVARRLRGGGPPAWELVVDGKPLVVGGCSKDPDAKRGRAAGGFARGYKLHALWGGGPLPERWEVTPLSAAESVAAQRLVAQVSGKGVLLADGNYDSNDLFDRAWASGYQLLVPPDSPNAGAGHHYQSPARLRSIAWFRDGLGAALYRARFAIEQWFGNATAFAGGLGALPPWVRRLGRVARWVWCKLVINAARVARRRQRMKRLQ